MDLADFDSLSESNNGDVHVDDNQGSKYFEKFD